MLPRHLPADLAGEYQALSDWIHRLLKRHPSRLAITVIDAASIEGVWKSLRHGVRRYPATVVAGCAKAVGTDFGEADRLIDRYVAAGPG